MLEEFISFVQSVLPSVDPDSANAAKAAISQFEKLGQKINYLTSCSLDQLSQGDILSKVPFSYFDDDGKQKMFTADAMVLSTSCHIDHRDKIILVPVLPIESVPNNSINELKRNHIFEYMHIPDGSILEKYVDFTTIGSYSKELIDTGIANGSIRRLESLNQIGLYFLIIKLTVYFMRKEDPEMQKERICT